MSLAEQLEREQDRRYMQDAICALGWVVWVRPDAVMLAAIDGGGADEIGNRRANG